MPELPEVETIKLGLSKLLPGKKVQKVTYDWPKSFPNSKADVDKFLIGAKVLRVKRRAKVLLIELDSKYSLVTHLKMTGQLVYVPYGHKLTADSLPAGRQGSRLTAEKKFGGGHPSDSLIGRLPDRSTRVITGFIGGSKLFFNDQRKFGWMRLVPTTEVPNIDFFKKVGPEPLAASFKARDFTKRLQKRPNSSVKAVLLDQTIIAGVGNIYADEALWGAKIHPSTVVNRLNGRSIYLLFEELQYVLKLSIEKGGSTDRNYVNHEGKKGSYMSFARVFRREGQTCPRCGATIIKTRVAGRGTHTCPNCQKESKK